MSATLRKKIVASLKDQGFSVNGHVEPSTFDKSSLRDLHEASKQEQLRLHQHVLCNEFPTVQKYLVNGRDINPSAIRLELRQVEMGSEEQSLYRWWNLAWWSVPYQQPYGRQMRFILWDVTHNAPFGLIGLQSPILKIAVRDEYLKIPKDDLDLWVNKSLQAQRLGALPPYNQLLGGKMVAMAITSNELRRAYRKKYTGVKTLMEERVIDPDLLFVSTTSAFGRSSIYNRLKYFDDPVAISLGYTKGSGTFHIPQDLYKDIQKFLLKRGFEVTSTFGDGPSKKIKLLTKAFSLLNLPDYKYHNIQREFFLFPLAKNIHRVIEKDIKPQYYNRPLEDMTRYWISRWASKRAWSNNEWQTFDGYHFTQLIMNNLE